MWSVFLSARPVDWRYAPHMLQVACAAFVPGLNSLRDPALIKRLSKAPAAGQLAYPFQALRYGGELVECAYVLLFGCERASQLCR